MSATTSAPTTPEELLHRLDWRVLRRLEGHLQGDHRTNQLGDGLDVADMREYQPDDDVRRIDWNVTARMDTPHVRQYEADRDLTAWFLIDRSASMQFGHSDRSKEVVAAELVTALARLLTHRGNRVGAVLWNNRVEVMAEPRSGRTQVLRIARHLLRPATDVGAQTSLSGLLRIGAGLARRRSLLVVVSDFLTEPGWDTELRQLGSRHDVIAIRLVDPQEVELPDAGLVVVQDSETGQQITVDTSDPRFRQRFSEASDAREQVITDATKRAGVDFHTVSTSDDLTRAILSIVAHRTKRRR